MRNRKKIMLCFIILTFILFAGCKIGKEEGGELSYTVNETENEEMAEVVDSHPEETLKEREIPNGTEVSSLISDPINWIRFKESSFNKLTEYRRETNTELTYDDFHRDIDYRLMMEEEKVMDLFGAPKVRVEDPFAYKMYVLEYEGLIIYVNDYGHGLYATGFYVNSPGVRGPRGTEVGQTMGEVLLAYPLPHRKNYKAEEGRIHWGDQTENYGAHMATIRHYEDGEIAELRFAESTGFAGVTYEISGGVVQSIYFFEMN